MGNAYQLLEPPSTNPTNPTKMKYFNIPFLFYLHGESHRPARIYRWVPLNSPRSKTFLRVYHRSCKIFTKKSYISITYQYHICSSEIRPHVTSIVVDLFPYDNCIIGTIIHSWSAAVTSERRDPSAAGSQAEALSDSAGLRTQRGAGQYYRRKCGLNSLSSDLSGFFRADPYIGGGWPMCVRLL